MAQFRASIINGKGQEVSRLGSKAAGIQAQVNGWTAGVTVEAAHIAGADVFFIYATKKGHRPRMLGALDADGEWTPSEDEETKR